MSKSIVFLHLCDAQTSAATQLHIIEEKAIFQTAAASVDQNAMQSLKIILWKVVFSADNK